MAKMCEITKNNISDLFDKITDAIYTSTFVCVDCEFSSLCSNNDFQNSLFDTPVQRYRKSRENLRNAIPMQIGITTFSFNRDENIYTAKPFIFYIMPPGSALFDVPFICQSSSFSFLCDYKFDFNKFVYDGLPYLNRDQEIDILRRVREGSIYSNIKFGLQNKIREIIQQYNSLVAEWFYSKASDKNELILFDIKEKSHDLVYVIHKELRMRFCKADIRVWTWTENNKFKVKKVSKDIYTILEQKSNLDKELYDYYLGFTKIFRLLSTSKKPLIGHNFLLDLMLLINTFEKNLPISYTSFKRQCLDLFPNVYDTKYLSFELRNELPECDKWQSNGLEELYVYFRDEKGRHLVKNCPQIEIDTQFNTFTTDSFHNAGWDSYCTGYCFIRIAHYYAARNYENPKRILMSSEHFKAVENLKNKVNIIRATVSHLNLEGMDPVSERPPYLLIRSIDNKPIDIFRVTELLSQYGSIEIKHYAGRTNTALAAVANFSSAKRILGQFSNHKEFRIATFNRVKHSPVFRAALWGGVLASTSILVWIIGNKISS